MNILVYFILMDLQEQKMTHIGMSKIKQKTKNIIQHTIRHYLKERVLQIYGVIIYLKKMN